jgi:hypothetical protein
LLHDVEFLAVAASVEYKHAIEHRVRPRADCDAELRRELGEAFVVPADQDRSRCVQRRGDNFLLLMEGKVLAYLKSEIGRERRHRVQRSFARIVIRRRGRKDGVGHCDRARQAYPGRGVEEADEGAGALPTPCGQVVLVR